MKFFSFLLFLFLFATRAIAQQNHFIYIQTENKQAFYVKLADRLLSSSATGYLLIPKLQDGNYDLNIGFPKNEWPLQRITITVKNKDVGYVLKYFESKGWGLYNMETLDVNMSSSNATAKDSVNETISDGFADVLAEVVSTPSIKQKPVPKEIKEEKETPVSKTEPAIDSKNIAEVRELKPAVKLFSTLDTGGRSIVYTDIYDDKVDTIRIFIPYQAIAEVKEPVEKAVQTDETVKKEEPKQEPKTESRQDAKFLDMELPNPNSKVDSAVNNKPVISNVVDSSKREAVKMNNDITEPKVEHKAVIMINSDCKMAASNEDLLKLRKKMAAEKSDDEMIIVAKKTFKSKCFSTEQVSNLSELFLKDEGKYNFFDAAYPRVSDTQNFVSLVSKLSDEYYITRFKAMIRH